MKTLKLSGITLGLLSCLVIEGPAKAVSITGSVTVGYIGLGSIAPCSNTQSIEGEGAFISFSVDAGSCPYPIVNAVTGTFTSLSGDIMFIDCGFVNQKPVIGTPNCSADMTAAGYYYFSGSGMDTFAFGSFINGGPELLPVTLDISGPGCCTPIVMNLGGIDTGGPMLHPVITLELGQVYYVSYEMTIYNADEGGDTSYDFTTPGLNITEVPEPASGMLVSAMILVFILFRRVRLNERAA
jgi:hypothetical protein